MTAQKKQLDFEAAISRLDEITDQLESGEVSLEKSIDLYTEGLKLAAECDARLKEAEKKIRIIREKSGLVTEEEFDEGNG